MQEVTEERAGTDIDPDDDIREAKGFSYQDVKELNIITKLIREDPDCLTFVMERYFDDQEEFEAADDEEWNWIQEDLYMETQFPEEYTGREYRAINKMIFLISDHWHEQNIERSA